MKRRSFLAFLGLAPAYPALAAVPQLKAVVTPFTADILNPSPIIRRTEWVVESIGPETLNEAEYRWEQVACREDLTDIIYEIAPQESPFFSHWSKR